MTYHAVATREGRYWLVHITEIDRFTQAPKVVDIEPMTRSLIALCLDVPVASVDVEVKIQLPASVQQHLQRANELFDDARRCQAASADERRAAARELQSLDLTVREIGTVLGISHQRAQQLLSG